MIFLWVSGIKGIGKQSGEKKLVVVVVQESFGTMLTKTPTGYAWLLAAMDVHLRWCPILNY